MSLFRHLLSANFALVLLAALLLQACGKPSSNGKPGSREVQNFRLEQRGVEIRLIDHLAEAEIGVPLARIEMNDPATTRTLTAGWLRPVVEANGPSYSWATGRSSSIEFSRAVARDLSLGLHLGSARLPESFPPQEVRILWNGDPISSAELELGRKLFEVQIPAASQRVGSNRLELQPNYWVSPRATGFGTDRDALGPRCFRIDVRETVRDAAPPQPPLRAEPGGLRQFPTSVASFFLALPRDARLRVAAALDVPAGADLAALEGRVTLAIADEKGGQKLLLDRDLASLGANPRLELDHDLSAPEGQMIAVSLSFQLGAKSAASLPAGNPLSIVWREAGVQGVAEEPAAEPLPWPGKRPNILVVLFDTLRPDFLEPYGSSETKTPAMRAFAEDGVLFEHAYAPSSWTRASVASLFTSLSVASHKTNSYVALLPEGLPSLAQILRNLGYSTTAIQNNPNAAAEVGFGSGFDRFHSYYNEHESRMKQDYKTPEDHARYVWDSFIAEPADQASEQPFFVYLHEIDPHHPYEPKPPFDAMYASGYRGNIDRFSDNGSLNVFIAGEPWFANQDIRYFQAQYRGEISWMDGYLKAILDRLDEAGLRESTLVIFTSDHGEAFYEHQRFLHSFDTYEEMIRVPLILRMPGLVPEGKRLAAHASLLDLAPTILALAGGEPDPRMQGRNLWPLIRSAPADYAPPRPVVSIAINGAYDSLRYGPWKLVRKNGRMIPSHELYNLEKDPGEQLDLWSAEPTIGRTLKQMLEHQHQQDALVPVEAIELAPEHMPPAIVKGLKALGYLN